MFRRLSGYKARLDDLTLYVASDFDEWRVLITGPSLTINGARQFSESKAKDHAYAVARSYMQEERHQDLPEGIAPEWKELAPGEWVNWRS